VGSTIFAKPAQAKQFPEKGKKKVACFHEELPRGVWELNHKIIES